MGIRTRNLSTTILELQCSGAVTAAANKDALLIPFDGFISNIVAVCASGGTGATNSILDVNYQGTTIFSAATKITLASTTGVATYSAFTNDPQSVTYGAAMTLDADSVSTNLMGVKVYITLSRNNPCTPTNLTEQDAVL